MIRQLNDAFKVQRFPETIADFTTCYGEHSISHAGLMQAECLLAILATLRMQRQ